MKIEERSLNFDEPSFLQKEIAPANIFARRLLHRDARLTPKNVMLNLVEILGAFIGLRSFQIRRSKG